MSEFDEQTTRDVENDVSDLFEDSDNMMITDEAIAVMAGVATSEVRGVAGMSGGCAGHSRGSCCFLAKDEDGKDFLISGDTLFSDNIGRCDLYGGDEAEMARSLKRLSTLDGSMTIYPGHGGSDTLGRALMSAAYFIDLN